MFGLFTEKQKPPSLEQHIHQAYDDHRNFYVEQHQFLLLKIHKVASTSLWIAAGKLLGKNIESREQMLAHSLPALPGYQLSEHPEVFKAGFVRNPWDRLLSCYQQKKAYKRHKFYKRNNLNIEMSFAEFVAAVCAIPECDADKHFRSQYTFVTNPDGELLTDFIGRFEHLAEDFEKMCEQAQLPSVTLPHRNKTKHKPYTDYYTPELAEAVAERYTIDLQLFGYEFGQTLSETARFKWQQPIPLALQLKIAQYKSKKLLKAIEQVSQFTPQYK